MCVMCEPLVFKIQIVFKRFISGYNLFFIIDTRIAKNRFHNTIYHTHSRPVQLFSCVLDKSQVLPPSPLLLFCSPSLAFFSLLTHLSLLYLFFVSRFPYSTCFGNRIFDESQDMLRKHHFFLQKNKIRSDDVLSSSRPFGFKQSLVFQIH